MKWWVFILLPFHLLAQETYNDCDDLQPQNYQVEYDANKIYNWQISNGDLLFTNNIPITVRWPDSLGTFIISVYTTRFGCEGDTSYHEITIEDCPYIQFFIPNSFTPNQDNHNETFYVHGADADKIKSMIVYNRWGEKIYETTSNEPWDGNNCQNGMNTYSIRTHNQHYTGQVN